MPTTFSASSPPLSHGAVFGSRSLPQQRPSSVSIRIAPPAPTSMRLRVDIPRDRRVAEKGAPGNSK